jgi:methylmalonyl-CoA mutase
LPVIGTIASQFNDPGTNQLYAKIIARLSEKTGADLISRLEVSREMSEKVFIIPPNRTRYLSEISENNRAYDKWVREQSEIADKLYAIEKALKEMESLGASDKNVSIAIEQLKASFDRIKMDFRSSQSEHHPDLAYKAQIV